MYGRASSSRPPALTGPTEFDILKASHKFLREDDTANTDDADANTSWEDRLAAKYYASLYREFAVCDLKHYKSGNFALRWRTEAEVLSGTGEETCGNTRCSLHEPLNDSARPAGLKTVELPFVYEEHGARKSALVKVVLCDTCLKKLMWKREREKEKEEKERRLVAVESRRGLGEVGDSEVKVKEEEDEDEANDRLRERLKESRKRRRSRSRSPTSRRRRREHRDKHNLTQHERPSSQ